MACWNDEQPTAADDASKVTEALLTRKSWAWRNQSVEQPMRVPPKAWVVTFAGTAVNLCLGILYAWSVWKASLTADLDHPAGSWQYGGGLSLLPAFTADYFGPKNLGFNYGLVFLGWGFAFFVPQLASYIKDFTGSLDYAFYLSGGLLLAGVIVSRFLQRPLSKRRPG
jgi:hypothetical protein